MNTKCKLNMYQLCIVIQITIIDICAFNEEKKGSFMGEAFKLGTELVAAVVVGTIIGFILDTWFGTKPWLIIIFFFIGSIAGMLNVIRTAKRMQDKE